MAGLARRRVACRGVDRVRRAGVVRGVAGIASGVRELEVPVRVAGCTRSRNMCSCQRKLGGTVIERRGSPCGGRVACLAGLAEFSRNVIRIRRSREVCAVTLVAV